MPIAPTAGIAAAWSAAKPTPSDQASELASDQPSTLGDAPQQADEPKKSPPAPEGQGTRLDVRV